MEWFIKARRRIADLIRHVPIIDGLPSCTLRDHRKALAEWFFSLLFSLLPLFISFAVELLRKYDTQFIQNFESNVANGELFLYVTSILGPGYYILMRERHPDRKFPSKQITFFIYLLLMCLASFVFGLQRAGFTFDKISLLTLSYIAFFSSIPLFYLILVYNNSIGDPSQLMRDDQDDFVLLVKGHRR